MCNCTLLNKQLDDKKDDIPNDPNTKKVCFKDSKPNLNVKMVVDLILTPILSWKDMVLRKGSTDSKRVSDLNFVDEVFSFVKGDVKKSMVNGIPHY